MPLVGNKISTTSDNFASMVRKSCLLVDKTLMVKEFIDSVDNTLLITRPRRFGKTLNMSMLHHFLAAEIDGESTKDLFKDFAIAQIDGGSFLNEHQGKYPVIFITFKDVKEPTYEGVINKIRSLIQKLYRQHKHLLISDTIDENDKEIFKKYCGGNVNHQELEEALEFLSEFLHKVHNKRVIILIDEYDTPLTSAYEHGYINDLSNFMRNMFSAALKSNAHLEKGLMTGILRVSQNSMLSGLNNLEIYTVLDKNYEQYFGFTEEEVQELIGSLKVSEDVQQIRGFYNGYKIGDQVIYNPWSLMNYFKKKELRPYWVLTSNDKLLRDLLLKSSDVIKEQFTQLIAGDFIEVPININLRYEDLIKNTDTLWTLLLFCGYLKVENTRFQDDVFICELKIPNNEVAIQYKTVFTAWLKEKIGLQNYDSFLKNLVENRIEIFINKLRDYLLGCASSQDFTSESNYHTFVLGLLSGITATHYLHSNKEFGAGFADVILIPKDVTNTQGIILEFKYVSFKNKHADDHKNMRLLSTDTRSAVVTALKQIDMRGYSFTFSEYPHIKEIIKIGIAFANRFVAAGSVMTDVEKEGLLVMKSFEEENITFYSDPSSATEKKDPEKRIE